MPHSHQARHDGNATDNRLTSKAFHHSDPVQISAQPDRCWRKRLPYCGRPPSAVQNSAHRYSLTPALAFVGSYTFTDGTVTGTGNNNSPKWHTFVLGTDYSLSKRTDVYLAGVYQHASGSLGYDGNGTPIQNVASINMLSPSSTNNQVAATVGLRHRF